MSKVRYSDNAATVLTVPAHPGDTVLIIASAVLFPILSGGAWMYVTVEEEVLKITATSGNVFTTESVKQEHEYGASVEIRVTTDMLDDIQNLDVYDGLQERPGAGTLDLAEPYVNVNDRQIGVGNVTGNPIDLVGVRFHASSTGYSVGDIVVKDGGLWKATLTHSGAWNENNWEPVSGGGGLNWVTVAADVNPAENGQGYLFDTNAGIFTAHLPVGEDGIEIGVGDWTGNAGTNNITVHAFGTEKIMGLAEDLILDTNNVCITLTYANDVQGWRIVQTTPSGNSLPNILYGEGVPSDSLGHNGDIYLQIV